MTRCASRSATCAAVLVWLLAPFAGAVPITWRFTGILRVSTSSDGHAYGSATPGQIPAALGALGVEIGAPVTGSLTFESTTPDVSGYGFYPGAVQSADVTIGAWSLSSQPSPNGVEMFLDPPIFSGENLDVDLSDPTGLYASIQLDLELTDRPGYVFASSALPLSPPPLSELDPFGFDLSTLWGYGTNLGLFSPSGDGLRVELTSLAVPEPGSLSLVATLAALAPLAARRRRAREWAAHERRAPSAGFARWRSARSGRSERLASRGQ